MILVIYISNSPPNAYITTHFLDLTHSTILPGHICNYQLDIYTRVLKHFKLYITKTQLTFNLFTSFYDGKTAFYSPESDSRINRAPAIAPVSFPSSLPCFCCMDPCCFFPMTGITLLISVPSSHGPILNIARAIF